MIVTKFYVTTRGDRLVGIQAVDTSMDLQFDIEDIGREELRKELAEFFSDIYGEKVGIEFEDERRAWMDEEDKLMKQQEKIDLYFIGNDSCNRPVYTDIDEKLFVDVDPRSDRAPKICTKYRNALDGEPDIPAKGEFEFLPKRVVWR